MAIVDLLRRERIGGWEIASTEHPWSDPETGQLGATDIVLTSHQVALVVECRKQRDVEWVFFVPKAQSRLVERAIVKDTTNENWVRLKFSPPSEEAEFCQIRADGDAKTPERWIATALLPAVESIAADLRQMESKPPHQGRQWAVIPVVVTNAPLWVCRFDPASVDLSTGQSPNEDLDLERVDLVRFRRTFLHRSIHRPYISQLSARADAHTHTVLVISASTLVETLRAFDW
jgi:hypothetical protein